LVRGKKHPLKNPIRLSNVSQGTRLRQGASEPRSAPFIIEGEAVGDARSAGRWRTTCMAVAAKTNFGGAPVLRGAKSAGCSRQVAKRGIGYFQGTLMVNL